MSYMIPAAAAVVLLDQLYVLLDAVLLMMSLQNFASHLVALVRSFLLIPLAKCLIPNPKIVSVPLMSLHVQQYKLKKLDQCKEGIEFEGVCHSCAKKVYSLSTWEGHWEGCFVWGLGGTNFFLAGVVGCSVWCLRFAWKCDINSKWFNVHSKCPVLHLQHLTSRLDSIPHGFGNFCFIRPTWTGNHCHVSMLQCRPWEHQKTSTISVAPNVTPSSQDVDSNEVSVDHAKGVMNFIDETAWNLVHVTVYSNLQKSPVEFISWFPGNQRGQRSETSCLQDRWYCPRPWTLGEKKPVELSRLYCVGGL